MTTTQRIIKHSKVFLEAANKDAHIRWAILLGTVAIIAVLLLPSLSTTVPQYKIGDVVRKDIKSPKDFLIEDKEATQKKRAEAARSALTVYDFDNLLALKLKHRISQAFKHMQTLLSEDNPRSSTKGADVQSVAGSLKSKPPNEVTSLHDQIWSEKSTFENMLGVHVDTKAYKVLVREHFSEQVSQGIAGLVTPVLENGIVGNKQLLIQQQQKAILVRQLSPKQETRCTDFQKFYSLEDAKAAVAKAGKSIFKDLDYPVRKVIIGLAQSLLQPNLTLNKEKTEERRNQAIANAKAVLTQVKQGEMLVREGEKISRVDMLKLQALESEMRKEDALASTLGFVLLAITFFVISFVVTSNTYRSPPLKNKDLLFLSVMLIVLFLLSEVSVYLVKGITSSIPHSVRASSAFYAIPVQAGAMTVCLFMGIQIALPFAVTIAFLTSFLFENQFEMFIFFMLSGMVSAYWVRNCKEQNTLIKAGLKVGVVNTLLVTTLYMFHESGPGIKLVWEWGFGLLGGATSGILTTGLAPVIEMIFGYTTNIKLLELANLDQPLLRKLMLQAPGTYHHSVIVGSLVEAAASVIGGNPLLGKVSGYYHDIGKIKKPAYFIENQARCKNRHDKLAPSMSSLILTSHVRDGVEIAKEHRLGKAIVDIIQQHHGTSLISYFYEKAKKLKGEKFVNIEHFRYPGPKPQTKEAGLVLLADAVEAASRTLENPTPARIKGLVQRIINNMFLDGQLDECELTLKDINQIANTFTKILTGIHHHRIEYPDPVTGMQGTAKRVVNGNFNQRHARSLQDQAGNDQKEGNNHPKRLRSS